MNIHVYVHVYYLIIIFRDMMYSLINQGNTNSEEKENLINSNNNSKIQKHRLDQFTKVALDNNAINN